MDSRKQILLGIVVISVFILLVALTAFVYSLSSEGERVPSLLVPFLQYHVQFMVLMGLFGVLAGLTAYHLLNLTLEQEKKVVKTNVDIIMKFLGPDEQEVVELLRKKEGRTTQSEISRLPGMTRLKAHRIVKKLAARGLVHVERDRKINIVRLVDELRGVSA